MTTKKVFKNSLERLEEQYSSVIRSISDVSSINEFNKRLKETQEHIKELALEPSKRMVDLIIEDAIDFIGRDNVDITRFRWTTTAIKLTNESRGHELSNVYETWHEDVNASSNLTMKLDSNFNTIFIQWTE